MEFFDSDRPRSWIPHELLKFMKKIAQNIAKNVAILILLNRAQSCELWGCVNQMGNVPNFPTDSSKQNVRSGLFFATIFEKFALSNRFNLGFNAYFFSVYCVKSKEVNTKYILQGYFTPTNL